MTTSNERRKNTMGIDWEWISGREGEKLDGWFPEPNDPVRRPQASYAVPYDEDYERLDEISVYADLYADDILDKMGNHCDPGNEEAYEETRFDIASEIYDLFLTKL
ncbi:MAG: hypothetical protein IK088_01955, partial [Lachnospiraceae bacterium]|nr:hypothetical protein [Lachnospiraceae bacterium]